LFGIGGVLPVLAGEEMKKQIWLLYLSLSLFWLLYLFSLSLLFMIFFFLGRKVDESEDDNVWWRRGTLWWSANPC
ncbi:hypothetical protein, partial [Klebsiella pneumoniae]|uniref:hypothetical protein n=1 Tax=Klebsiella pneumoniae TaxID=573 RepID=UPI0035307EBA